MPGIFRGPEWLGSGACSRLPRTAPLPAYRILQRLLPKSKYCHHLYSHLTDLDKNYGPLMTSPDGCHVTVRDLCALIRAGEWGREKERERKRVIEKEQEKRREREIDRERKNERAMEEETESEKKRKRDRDRGSGRRWERRAGRNWERERQTERDGERDGEREMERERWRERIVLERHRLKIRRGILWTLFMAILEFWSA